MQDSLVIPWWNESEMFEWAKQKEKHSQYARAKMHLIAKLKIMALQ